MPELQLENEAAAESAPTALEGREEAAPQIAQQDSDAMQATLRALHKQARSHKWLGGISLLLAYSLAFVLSMAVIIVLTMRGLDGAWPHVSIDPGLASGLTSQGQSGHAGKAGALTVSGTGPALLFLGSLWFSRLALRQRRKLSRAIAAYDNARAVGPLIESLTFGDRALVQQASTALVRLFPRLGPEDAKYLTSGQRQLIRLYLGLHRHGVDAADRRAGGGILFRGKKDPELAIAMINALARIGGDADKPALRNVIAVAKGSGAREAAQAALDAIDARQARERAPQVLLRPTDSPADPAATLLRPAASAGESDPKTLLRPAEQTEQTS